MGTLSKNSTSTRSRAFSREQTLAYAKDLGRVYAAEKEKRRLLELSYTKLHAVFDSMVDGMVITDPHNVIVEANASMSRMLNMKAGTMAKKSLFEVGLFSNLGAALTEMEVGKRTVGSCQVQLADLSGKQHYHLHTSISRLIGKDTVFLGWVIVFRDVSEQVRLERMKDEFIALLSQELKTPVAMIRAAAALLVEQAPTGNTGAIAATLNTINTASERLGNTFSELATMVEATVATSSYRREKVSVRKLIKEALARVKPHTVAGDIRIHATFPKTRPTIKAIPSQIVDCVYHLLLNAIHFSNQNGSVHCRLEDGKRTIRLKIQDDGRGIPRDELPRIFTKFYKGNSATAITAPGLGLGLPLVKQIVSNHHGKITVTSTAGKGSLFTLTLPKLPTESDVFAEHLNRLWQRFEKEHKQSLVIAKDLTALIKQKK